MTTCTSSLSILIILVIVVGITTATSQGQISTSNGNIHGLIMGDWGGQDTKPFYTSQEAMTATGMQKIGDANNASFALALGDNFYSFGIQTVESTRFQDTFENVFTNQIPFHVLAGNHDHRGNVSAQIAYSGHSKRWTYPSEYYKLQKISDSGDVTLDIFMIDTVILSGNCHVDYDDELELNGSELPGPKVKKDSDDQLTWLENELKASTADFIIVAGHYPIYSICEHGPTSFLINNVKPMLEKYKVNAYINGHDHCAQMISIDGDDIQYHTIGSAHENNPSTSHKNAIPSNSLKFHKGNGNGGFATLNVSSEGMVITHFDGDGNELFIAPTSSPRK